jgi:hypothetical protein
MAQLTAQAFGVIDKSGALWPFAAATEQGVIQTVADLFEKTEASVAAKMFKTGGYRVVPVTIIATVPE